MNVNSKLIMNNILPLRGDDKTTAVDSEQTAVKDEVSETVQTAYQISASEIIANYNQPFVIRLHGNQDK